MSKRTILRSVLLGGAAVILATSANAATLVFDFSSAPNDIGQTHTYTVAGNNLIASAWGPGSSSDEDFRANHLFGKADGGNENGIGMTNDPSGNNEIAYTNADHNYGFIQLDVGALRTAGFSKFTFGVNSSTSGEAWNVWGSNIGASVIGSPTRPTGALVVNGTNGEGSSFDLGGGYRYYDFYSTKGNFLIKGVTASVPEPASWALMIMGFGSLGVVLRRRSAVTLAAAT